MKPPSDFYYVQALAALDYMAKPFSLGFKFWARSKYFNRAEIKEIQKEMRRVSRDKNNA